MIIPSLQAGGMERVMSELGTYFIKRTDIDVSLVLYGITREVFYALPTEIVIYRPSFLFNKEIKLFDTIRTVLYLRNQIKKIDPHAILSFGEIWNSFVLISLLGLKKSIYISDRCQPGKDFGFFHNFLRKKFYPTASGIVAQTEKAANVYISEFYHTNIRIIGNPIREIKDRVNLKKENIVLTVGRLINTKHHNKLIDIFMQINCPDWRLVIVGYDHLNQNNSSELKKLIEDYRAEGKIWITGKQSDVEYFYLKSKIFAFTSSSEGFPNVIGEAMSAGLPVIAYDCVAGPSEMVKDGQNGYLIPLFDEVLFRRRLYNLMTNEELRGKFGNQARKDIKKFSIVNIAEQYIDFMNLK